LKSQSGDNDTGFYAWNFIHLLVS